MIVGAYSAASQQEQGQREAKARPLLMEPPLPPLRGNPIFAILATPAILAIPAVFSHDQAPPSFFRLTSCPSSNESAGFITI
jgi:hypothetical protein